MKHKIVRFIRFAAIYSILIGLLYFSLRNAPFAEIWSALRGLELWQIALLLGINILVILCMTARWWLIVRAEHRRVPFLPLVGYRLSAFGVSYFTPGPQVGGEPLQIIYLQKKYGLTYARAVSAVIMDKLLEFLVNFLLLSVGAWAILRVGLIPNNGIRSTLSLIGLAVLLTWPLAHILLMYNGFHPIAAILRGQPFIHKKNKTIRLLIASEQLAASFCQRHLRALFSALFVSILSMTGMAVEYYLMVDFLGIQLNALQVFAALTAQQIAFLIPLPGGLGALEASQVFALGAFGQSASIAISLTLLMRARDILNGGIGLLLAGRAIGR